MALENHLRGRRTCGFQLTAIKKMIRDIPGFSGTTGMPIRTGAQPRAGIGRQNWTVPAAQSEVRLSHEGRCPGSAHPGPRNPARETITRTPAATSPQPPRGRPMRATKSLGRRQSDVEIPLLTVLAQNGGSAKPRDCGWRAVGRGRSSGPPSAPACRALRRPSAGTISATAAIRELRAHEIRASHLRHTHWWSAVIRCQNTGDGVRFRASH